MNSAYETSASPSVSAAASIARTSRSEQPRFSPPSEDVSAVLRSS